MAMGEQERLAVLQQARAMLPEAETGDKRAAILSAAVNVFLREGFNNAGMEAIAREAGVAKQTVYSHFGSKDALFTTMLGMMCEHVVPTDAFEHVMALPPRQGLTEFGRIFLGGILSAHAVAVFRVVVAESQRTSDLGKMVYDAGPTRVKQTLYRYLERLCGQGALSLDDVPLAGEIFLGMLFGPFYMEKVLGVGGPPTPADLDRIVVEAVRVFVKAYGGAGNGKPGTASGES
jgi:TetR/AcrR family transcriptional regulator, mexJK operon transcriptional repressor